LKLRFLIAAPPFSHQSGGIMVLHNLCDTLNRLGYEAAIVFFYGGISPDFQWAISNSPTLYYPGCERVHLSMENPNKSIRDFLENGVIIYPDLIPHNPIGASRVVRYLLYFNKEYVRKTSSEYIVSFSKQYHDSPNSVLYKVFPDDNLHSKGASHWSKRTLDITYYGKGPKFIDCFRIPDTVLITRSWPEDKDQLGIILRQCRYFFTWDTVSQINVDAIACGAVPVLLHELQVAIAVLNEFEIGPYPGVKLHNCSDKESVLGDYREIDHKIAGINNAVAWYHETWPTRVRQFADNVCQHFHGS